MDQVADYTEITIVRDDIICGIISGHITYTKRTDPYERANVHGEAGRLMMPARFKEIYSSEFEDIGEKSVFDIVIKKNDQQEILKDVLIWPRPQCYITSDEVIIIENFKFRSW
jgi:hypothetical protein